MTETLPAPLVPAEVDLSKLDGFMLDTAKLLGSELVALATGDEFKAAVLLWCRAWKQRPAASLPNEDRVLASFAGVPLPRWKKLKPMALRGFVLCSDGRLYHRVLAEDAIRAHEFQTAQKRRTEAATEARKGGRKKLVGEPGAFEDNRDDERNVDQNNQRHDDSDDRRDDDRDVDRNEVPKTGQDIDRKKEEPTKGSSQNPATYAFRGATIRLTQDDYETWRSSYHAIPDIDAELRSLDDWLQGAGAEKRGSWFHVVSGSLSRKHQEHLQRRRERADDDRPNSYDAQKRLEQAEIRICVEGYAKHGQWTHHTPGPGRTGCKASHELLAEFGIAPDGSKLKGAA